MNITPSFILRRFIHRPGLIKILDNIGWLFLDKILRMMVGLIVGIWIARYLGPAQFGQLNYAIAFVGMFSAIAGLGLKGIVIKDIVLYPTNTGVTLGTAFILQFIAGIFSVLLVIIFIGLLKPDNPLIHSIVIIISISLLFKATDVIRYLYEAEVQSRYVIWIENAVIVLMGSVRLILIFSEASLMAFVWMILIETILISCGLTSLFLANGINTNFLQFSISRAKKLMHDGWPLLLATTATTLYMRIDIIMLEEMSNNREVGIYAAATRITEVWYFIPAIIVSSVAPSIIACYSTNKDLYLSRLKRMYFIMFWLALGVSTVVSISSEQIVSILYGRDYEDAAQVLVVHVWASVAVFLGIASSQHLLVNNLLRVSLYRTGIGLICNIVINIILIPLMGAIGAAIATVISYFIATFSLVFFGSSRGHLKHLILSPIVWK